MKYFHASAIALLMVLHAGEISAAAPAPLAIYAINGYPLSFMSDGHPDGMVVELANTVQKCVGKIEPIEIIPWAMANELAKKKPNILILPAVSTPERRRYFNFVGPILSVHVAAYALRSRADELLDVDPNLHSLRAGGRRGSVFVRQAKAAGYNFADETNTSESAVRMLIARRFDLWFESEEIATDAVATLGYDMKDLIIMMRFPPQMAHFAFSKGTPELVVKAWDKCLQKFKADGTFQRIHEKWLPNHEMPTNSVPPYNAAQVLQ